MLSVVTEHAVGRFSSELIRRKFLHKMPPQQSHRKLRYPTKRQTHKQRRMKAGLRLSPGSPLLQSAFMACELYRRDNQHLYAISIQFRRVLAMF